MNKKNQKNSIRIVILIAVLAGIWYLEAGKSAPSESATDIVPVLNFSSTTPATTDANGNTQKSAQVDESGFPRAKELVNPQGFINSNPFKLGDIVGKKVVLVDFWTYSCINCQRTLPYLNAWYKKYSDLGLEIVGVHTPEFDFEKDYTNVSKAVAAAGIKYPVVLDSNMGTWNAYQNLYWPHEYLIDLKGYIVHDKIGEGSYADTEKAIQAALRARNVALGLNTPIPTSIVTPADLITMDASKVASPETYFGAERNQFLGNGKIGAEGVQILSLPATSDMKENSLYLSGTWSVKSQYAETSSMGAKIVYKYDAKNVYFVASAATNMPVKVYQDGKLINTIIIRDNKLYTLIQGSDYGKHTLELDVDGPGLDAFTFTFG